MVPKCEFSLPGPGLMALRPAEQWLVSFKSSFGLGTSEPRLSVQTRIAEESRASGPAGRSSGTHGPF